MHAEPEYLVEVVDRVLVSRGNARVPHPDPHTLCWARRTDTGHIVVGAYKVPGGKMTIRESFVIAIARQLGYRAPADIAGLIREIKDLGGEAI